MPGASSATMAATTSIPVRKSRRNGQRAVLLIEPGQRGCWLLKRKCMKGFFLSSEQYVVQLGETETSRMKNRTTVYKGRHQNKRPILMNASKEQRSYRAGLLFFLQ